MSKCNSMIDCIGRQLHLIPQFVRVCHLETSQEGFAFLLIEFVTN